MMSSTGLGFRVRSPIKQWKTPLSILTSGGVGYLTPGFGFSGTQKARHGCLGSKSKTWMLAKIVGLEAWRRTSGCLKRHVCCENFQPDAARDARSIMTHVCVGYKDVKLLYLTIAPLPAGTAVPPPPPVRLLSVLQND